MAKDIVIQLKELAEQINRSEGKSTLYGAAGQIELFRTALEIGAGLLSTHIPEHPENVYKNLIEEARKNLTTTSVKETP